VKWFFALNQASAQLDAYVQMAQVAAVTARRHTALEAHCLWDGDDDHPFALWLRKNGVGVWQVRTPFYQALAEIAQKKSDPGVLSMGAGAFLRLEIPALAARNRGDDEFVLYTDCDVMFVGDPAPQLAKLRPRYFAIAPERRAEHRNDVNTGVMLINLRGMARVDEDFHRFTGAKMEYLPANAFGQAAFVAYFRLFSRALIERGAPIPVTQWKGYRLIWGRFYARLPFLDPPLWDALPLELNWKAYWPQSAKAVILHFHGGKPNRPHEVQWQDPVLRPLLNENFEHWSGEWKRVLAQVELDV